jgi:O-antigen/teichoic acid export membrane protein
MPVGVGLILNGLAAYAFLMLSARALGPEGFAPLSALWTLVFLAAPGFFLPLEQELGRRLASGPNDPGQSRHLIRQTALAGGLIAAGLIGASVATSRSLLDYIFDSDALLLVALLVSIIGYWVFFVTRGALSGRGRFRRYGILIGAEGILRLVGCLALTAVGVATAGPYGLMVGLAPLAALTVVALIKREPATTAPGILAPWGQMSHALGYLLVSSVLAQSLVNAAPLMVKILAAEHEQAVAGRFLAGLVLARVPLFLFQAVQAALLPKLAALTAGERHAEFTRALGKLLGVVAVIGLAVSVGAFVIGPWTLRLLFGPGFTLGRTDLLLLSMGSAVYMAAIALAQALIALSGHARVALGWLAGLIGFASATAMGTGLLLRVELGFLVGSCAAAATLGGFVTARLRSQTVAPLDVRLALGGTTSNT